MLTYSVVPKKIYYKVAYDKPMIEILHVMLPKSLPFIHLRQEIESRKSKLLLLHVLNFEIIWNPHNNYEIVGLTFLHSRHWVKLTTRSRDEFSRENKS